MVGVRVPVSFDGDFGTLMGGLERTLSGAGRVLGRTLQASAAVAGAGVAAAIGVSLTKGFGRLVAIDNATAKLTGLGNSAKTVETVMGDALASVRGTAFGLGDAATIAAGAIATGIKPGQDLQRTLKLVADAATIGGSSLDEMGAIFNKVSATGKVQGEVLAQLGERGIPILQLLGKELGKTPAEVQKLASEGKINFEIFQDAMEAGLGGAALESGKTFTGAMANVGAALGRLGASVLGGVFPQIKTVFGDVTAALDNMGPAAERIGATLGKGFATAYPAVLAAGTAISDLWTRLSPTMSLFEQLTGAWQGLVAGFKYGAGEITSSGLPGIGERIGAAFHPIGAAFSEIVRAVAPFLAQLVPLVTQASPLLALFKALGPLLPQIGTAISGLLTTALSAIVPLFAQLAGVMTGTLVPALTQLIVGALPPLAALLSLVATLIPPISQVIGALIPVISVLINAVLPILLSLFQVLTPVLKFLTPIIATLANVIATVLTKALQFILPHIGAIIFDFGKLGGAARTLWERFLKPAFAVISQAFATMGGHFRSIWTGFIRPVFEFIGANFRLMGLGIRTVYNAIIKPILTGFAAGVGVLWQLVKPVFADISEKWTAGAKVIRSGYNAHIKPIFNAFGDVVEGMGGTFRAGVDAIQTQWNKLQDVAKKPIDFVVQTVINNGLIKGFNFLAGILGTSKMDTIPWPPPGWQSGGFTGNMPVDAFAGYVHGKEWVINAGATKKFEDKFPGYLSHINRTGTLPGYKIGGFVGSEGGGSSVINWRGFQFTAEFAKRLQAVQRILATTLNITQGGFRPTTSYSGTSHQKDAVDIARPFDLRTIAALRSVGIAAWDRTGKGNWIDHIHGVPLPGAGVAGGSGVWQAQDYLRGGDGLGGRDTGPRGGILADIAGLAGDALAVITDIPGAMTDKFAGPLGRLSEISGTVFGEMIAAVPRLLKDAFLDKASELSPFDNGGFLQPGFTPAINNTGRPEAILTDEQWRILQGNMNTQQGSITYAPVFNGPTTGGARLRELDWTLRYRTGARSSMRGLDGAMV